MKAIDGDAQRTAGWIGVDLDGTLAVYDKFRGADHIGVELEITCVKDFAMVELWDDRAVSVIKNTGIAMVLDG